MANKIQLRDVRKMWRQWKMKGKKGRKRTWQRSDEAGRRRKMKRKGSLERTASTADTFRNFCMHGIRVSADMNSRHIPTPTPRATLYPSVFPCEPERERIETLIQRTHTQFLNFHEFTVFTYGFPPTPENPSWPCLASFSGFGFKEENGKQKTEKRKKFN